MPGLFISADQASMRGQRRHFRAIRAQLVMLASAAALGAFSWRLDPEGVDWAAFAAGTAFVLAGFVRIHHFTTQPDKAWFDGRAVAESVKTMAWRYAVSGAPFPLSLEPSEADREYLLRAASLLDQLDSSTVLVIGDRREEITAWMRELRDQPLAERKAAYDRDRLRDQLKWYSQKASANLRSGSRLNALTLALEGAGAVGAFLTATGTVQIDLLGFAGAAVAALTAWGQAKQHSALASSYSVAAHELSGIRALAEEPKSEDEWAAFVAEAEEAISREHTLWRSSIR